MSRVILALTMLILSGFLILHASENLSIEASETFQSGVEAFELGEYQRAQSLFETVNKTNDDHVDSLIYLARVNAKLDNWDEAGDFIEDALKLAPRNAFAHNLSGKINGRIAREASIFTALGYAEDSLEGFTKAVEYEPTNIDFHWDIIGFHLNAPGIAGGDKDIALAHAKTLASLNEKDGFLAFLNVYSSMEDEKALAAHIAVIPEMLKDDAEVLFELGMLRQRQENFVEAFKYFSASITSAENNAEVQRTLFAAIYQTGRTSVLSEQNIAMGIAALNRFIEQAPELENLPSKEWAQFRLANLMELNGSKQESKVIYRNLAKQTMDKELKKRAKKKSRQK